MIKWWQIYQAPADGDGSAGGTTTGGGASTAAAGGAAGGTTAEGGTTTTSTSTAAAGGTTTSGGSGTASTTDAAPWYSGWAGTDEKKLKHASRYADLNGALDASFNAGKKIEELSGRAKAAPLAADATPEQVTQYRKDNGIPEKAADYFTNLPKGLELDDGDKAQLSGYVEALHGMNLTPTQVHKLLAVRTQQVDAMLTQQQAADSTARKQVESTLHAEWGADFVNNREAIKSFLSGLPDGLGDEIQNARLPDGRALLNSASGIKWLAQLAADAGHKVPTIVGADGGAMNVTGIDQRLSEIEGWMGARKGTADYKRYWNDQKVQDEWRNLSSARDKMKARAG